MLLFVRPFNKKQIPPGRDVSVCWPQSLLSHWHTWGTHPLCQMQPAGPQDWREGWKPTLSMRNNKERKSEGKMARREDTVWWWVCLEADVRMSQCQCWTIYLCSQFQIIKPQLMEGYLGSYLDVAPSNPAKVSYAVLACRKLQCRTLHSGCVLVMVLLLKGWAQGFRVHLPMPLNDHNHCRASVYFQPTSVFAHWLIHTQQLASVEGSALPSGSWQILCATSPSLPCCIQHAGQGRKSQTNWCLYDSSLQFLLHPQPGKILPRYILGSCSGHCCFVCTTLSMLSVCLVVYLCDPAFQLLVLLFPRVTKTWLVRTNGVLFWSSQRTHNFSKWKHQGWDAACVHLSHGIPSALTPQEWFWCSNREGSPTWLLKAPR